MKNIFIGLLVLILSACGQPNPNLTEDDIGVLADDVNQRIKFAVVNSIYFENLTDQVNCDSISLNKDFTKITTPENYLALMSDFGCTAENVPAVDFNYFFLVFKESPDGNYEGQNPQAQIQEGTLAVYNLPDTVENNTFTTKPFVGWLAIPREYINLTIQTFTDEPIQL